MVPRCASICVGMKWLKTRACEPVAGDRVNRERLPGGGHRISSGFRVPGAAGARSGTSPRRAPLWSFLFTISIEKHPPRSSLTVRTSRTIRSSPVVAFETKKAFAVSFVAAMLMTAYTFWNLKSISDMLWMIPLMGFSQLALFGGYAIYLPELFPTRLRSTGTSFCYNVGRMVAAAGPFTLGLLTRDVFKGYPEPLRYAGVTMCLVFLVGMAALPFAPETKGKPLPE